MNGDDRGWEERADLLTFEEGLTGHPLSGDVYVCVNGVGEGTTWLAEQVRLLALEDGFRS